MPGRVPDLLDVRGPEAALDVGEARRGRLLPPEEVRLEGLHPRRRQEDRRIVD
jgi:hypothetical protein